MAENINSRYNESREEINDPPYKLVITKYNLPNKPGFNIRCGYTYCIDCYDFKLYVPVRLETPSVSNVQSEFKEIGELRCSITHDPFNLIQPSMYLYWIGVDETYQGRGRGKYLMDQCIALARMENCIKIQLENFADNDSIYKKQGFIYTDKTNLDGTPRESDQLGMTLFLNSKFPEYNTRSLYKSKSLYNSKYLKYKRKYMQLKLLLE